MTRKSLFFRGTLKYYFHHSCEHCMQFIESAAFTDVKTYCRNNKIRFIMFDIGKETHLMEFLAAGFEGTPTIILGDETGLPIVVEGFKPQSSEEILSILKGSGISETVHEIQKSRILEGLKKDFWTQFANKKL